MSPRTFLNGLAAVSGLLAIATVALWARSATDDDVVEVMKLSTANGISNDFSLDVGSFHGTLGVSFHSANFADSGPTYSTWRLTAATPQDDSRFGQWASGWAEDDFGWKRFGFVIRCRNETIGAMTLIMTVHDFGVGVPHWLLIAIFMAAALRWRRKQRPLAISNACTSCGYSLFGNFSGVCPECGAACKTTPHSGQRSGVARTS